MEDYLRGISKDLQTETEAFSLIFEPGYKQLAANTFDCMSDCFRKPGSADDSGICAEQCSTKLGQYQADVDERVQSIQVGFQNCIQQCAGKKDENDLLKQCVFSCSDETKQLFARAKAQANEIASKYLV
jgi:inosine/xanthosine triphosphate pyrophosphatase family protein